MIIRIYPKECIYLYFATTKNYLYPISVGTLSSAIYLPRYLNKLRNDDQLYFLTSCKFEIKN